MLGWKDVSHLSVAYGNFEGLDKIKENDPQICQHPSIQW